MRTSTKTVIGALVLVAGLALGTGVSAAQDTDPYTEDPPGAVDQQQNQQDDRDPEVRGEQVARNSGGGELPVTGGDVVGLVVLGVGAIGAGGGVLLYRRRTA